MQFGIKCGVFFWLLFSTNTVVAYRGEINFRRCTFAKGDRKVRVHGYMLRSRDVTLSRMTLRGMGDNILHRCSGKGARLIHSFVLIAVAVSTSLLGPVLPGQAATALPLPALAIISPGYLLQPRQYESYVEALRKASIPTIVQTGSEIDRANDNTAAALHRDATAVVERNPQHVPVVLIGHSRGGAVAAIAATEMNGMKRPPMLVLLDPVDTSPPTALSLIATPPTAPPTAQALTPVLIVSMPYGGYSSFYRTYYESACAPAQRNGEAFAAALAQRYAPRQRVLQVSSPPLSPDNPTLHLFRITHVQCTLTLLT